tara:strand:+ start:40 stop:339 length:300 start_codon:yes stop_codon:yes gene_type:complete
MASDDYNKIISTVSSITSDYTYIPDPNNLICIDSSNNRIGINTVNPEHSIDISNGNIFATSFITKDSSFNDISLNYKINEIIDILNKLTNDASNIKLLL